MAKSAPTLRRGSMVSLRTNGGDHPCIMLTDAYKILGHGTPEIIQVHLTTSKKHYDPTCVFHERIGKLIMAGSWVRYEKSLIRKVADIEAEIRKRGLKIRMISREIYIRIIDGLLANPLTPPDVRDIFDEALSRGFAG